MSPSLKTAVTISVAIIVLIAGIRYLFKVPFGSRPEQRHQQLTTPSDPAHRQQSTLAPAGVNRPQHRHYGIHPLTARDWETQVFKSTVPVLVLFCAEWAGPCKMSRPVLAQIADEFGDHIKVGTLDVDENEGISTRYNVRAVPTWLLFTGGQVRDQRIGAVGKSAVYKMLMRYTSAP